MRVLVVENQAEAARLLVNGLERHGHEIVTVTNGMAIQETHLKAELVLLKLELPDIDGLEVCRRIRHRSDTPIIAFAEGGAGLDRVLVLQAGADDCLEKPYEFRELLARIEAVMRRARSPNPPSPPTGDVSIGGLRINVASRHVHVNGRRVELTRMEFDLLHYLASNPETVLTRQRLMADVWGDSTDHALSPRVSRTIDTHVSSLRNKLGGSGWIVTVRGIGFRLGNGAGRS